MFTELIVAFLLVTGVFCVIYLFGRRLTSGARKNEVQQSTYACGEKAEYHGLRINIAAYKYLIFFAIIDSSILLVAFASFAAQAVSFPFLIIYLLIILITVFLLFEGGQD